MEKTNNQQWLEERKTYLGGTDIGAIIGINSYRSALDIYLDKISDEAPIQEDNEVTYWGRNLEDLILKEYAKRTGANVTSSIGTKYHEKYPFLACNIDGWVNDEYILECKTAGLRSAGSWGEEGTDEIPETYLCQVAWYCAITKAKKADIAVLIGGQDFRIYTYQANENFQEKLIQAGVNFWQEHVLKKVAPDPTNTQQLAKLYNTSNETSLEASEDIWVRVHELKEMQRMKKAIEEDIKEAQFKIQDFMREYDVLQDEYGKVIATWKNRKSSNRLDSKALKENFPDIYNQHLKEHAPSRTFLIK